jgi:hypothetical protein
LIIVLWIEEAVRFWFSRTKPPEPRLPHPKTKKPTKNWLPKCYEISQVGSRDPLMQVTPKAKKRKK